jgi:putative serine protease PepD
MAGRLLFVLLASLLAGCAAPSVPVATAPPPPYLAPIRFDDSGTAFAQPINVRMQAAGRRDFMLRLRMDASAVPDGFVQDFTYRGSVRTAARSDGRTAFAIYVDAIDGAVSAGVGAGAQRMEVRENGLSQPILESVHNLDNTFHEFSLPLLTTFLEADRSGAVGRDRDAGRLLALKTLSENLWPLFPVRTSRLAAGASIWPESGREFGQLLEHELIPAMARSPQFREMFDRTPASQRGGIQDYQQFMRHIGAAATAMFRGSDMTFGGRISGARVWNGQDVLESAGPVRATFAVGSGTNAISARMSGDNHVLIDPYSGITVRTEFSVSMRLAASGGRGFDVTQQISASVLPPENRIRIPAAPPAASATPSPRGDVPAGGTARRISDIYASSIGSIFTVRAGGSIGSGFAVGRDLVLTNRHVVDGHAGEFVDLEQNGARVVRARVERVFDGAFDLAVLRTERPLDAAPLELARDLPAIGTEVLIVGSPVGLDGSISGGIVSQLRVIARAGYVQVDAAINPGNSGGPVFDRLGRVIGIATMRLEPGRAAGSDGRPIIGIGFALSSETVRDLLASARVSSRAVPF